MHVYGRAHYADAYANATANSSIFTRVITIPKTFILRSVYLAGHRFEFPGTDK